MSTTHREDHSPPEHDVVDGFTLEDICWLLLAVEDFALFASIEAVTELLAIAGSNLSAGGLATATGELSAALRRRIEAAR
jgi:hypothetical protein